MNNGSREFLYSLLKTPSPSGWEIPIQKKVKSYMETFADEVKTDLSGNVVGIVNKNAPLKVLIAGHCDEIGLIVTNIESNGFIRIGGIGRISPKPALGLRVKILGYKKVIHGVIVVNAEHHGGISNDIKFEDLYVDCGAKSQEEILKYIKIGDPVVYISEPIELLNDELCGRGLDNRTGCFIISEVLKRISKERPRVGLYAVSTVNEETNFGGAYFAAAGIKPNFAIACDVTFATDYPSVDKRKYGDIQLHTGPVLAKGAPINTSINQLLESSAQELSINLQYELTTCTTGTDADRMRLTGVGVPVALVSLPLRYMHSPSEVVSTKVIEQEIQLLTHMILNLPNQVNLSPFA